MIQITEQAFRDGNQSLVASRIKIEDLLGIARAFDQVGFFSAEVWSGSIFECCLRFLNEDPWDRLKRLKEHMPNTSLQTLLRSQSLLGFRIFSDETVYQFIHYATNNGCHVFSIFDSLNDPRNMKVPIKAVKKEGGIAEACITYAQGPVHTIEKWLLFAKEL
jgi:oxaloacetate decarboxylase alpha subunit